jgi:hypothetical protein
LAFQHDCAIVVIKNFVDYLQKFTMFYLLSHAFERVVDPKKVRVKGGIFPKWQLRTQKKGIQRFCIPN